MCAQYLLFLQAKDLEELFGISISENFLGTALPENFQWHERITPHTNAPVVTHDGFHLMTFSLLPSWSQESRQKFATFNARVETLTEKPTWKKPFESKRCLIPLNSFIEPIYEHELAGNMVGFQRADRQPLVAAGIYDQWINQHTGEIIDSFAMITTPALEFVKKVGHDRSPLFLPPKAFKQWLTPEKQNPQNLLRFLK